MNLSKEGVIWLTVQGAVHHSGEVMAAGVEAADHVPSAAGSKEDQLQVHRRLSPFKPSNYKGSMPRSSYCGSSPWKNLQFHTCRRPAPTFSRVPMREIRNTR